MLIFNVAKENVVKHRYQIYIKHSIFERDEEEINELGWWPNEPIGDVNCQELLTQQLMRFIYALAC